MFSTKLLIEKIQRAVDAIADAVSRADAYHQQRLAQISELENAAEAVHQKRSAEIARQLLAGQEEARRESEQRMTWIRNEYESTLAEARKILQSAELSAGISALADLPADYIPSVSVPSVYRIGTLTLESPYARVATPALVPFTSGRNLIIKATGPEAKSRAAQALQSIVLRLLYTVPPSKLRLVLLDPIGLGRNLAVFVPRADRLQDLQASSQPGAAVSADQFIQNMAAGKVWTEPSDIEKQLLNLSGHLERVVQRYLVSLPTIEDYNEKAGDIEEAYRLLVAMDFPVNFTDQAARRLVSIASNGPRCGVYSLIMWDMEQKVPHGFNPADLESTATVINWDGSRFVQQESELPSVRLELDAPPPATQMELAVQKIWAVARNNSRVVVPFDKIALPPDQWWQDPAGTTYRLMAAIGRTGAADRQYFQLGEGMAVHALLTGKTGSGKSNLLHVLIMSLSITYTPEDLELYLIDFKQGVEFKDYIPRDDGTKALPHAKVIAIESEREFGLSVLQGLVRLMNDRLERMKISGCRDLQEYRRKYPDERMPRVLLLVDEFQVFFNDDDVIHEDAKRLLDHLVRQSRAAGIHMILASQTLEGNRTLPSSTMSQIAVRIALQASTIADSEKMVGTREAYLLERQGEGIYNSNGGLPQNNALFQVPLMTDGQREATLESLCARRPDALAPIVFQGNRRAPLSENSILRDRFKAADWPAKERIVRAYIGSPVAIKEPTSATFFHGAARNLLVIARDEEAAIGILFGVTLSLAAALSPESARFYVWNMIHPESDYVRHPNLIQDYVPHKVIVGEARTIGGMIEELASVVTTRRKQERWVGPEIFVLGFGMQRGRDLVPSPGRSIPLVSSSNNSATTGDLFGQILREGPEVGVHVVGWWDAVSSLGRTLDKNLLREFGMRVVLNMSKDDSRTVIEEPDAVKLGPYRGLYWDEEHVGRLEKFIPYEPPTEDWLKDELNRLRVRSAAVSTAAAGDSK